MSAGDAWVSPDRGAVRAVQGWDVITTTTGRGGLDGLPALLTLLGSEPSADAVAEAVVTDTAAAFGVHAAIVLVVEGEQLRLVGSHGYSPSELAGFDVIPLALDLPVCQAVREAETIVTSSDVAVADYAGLAHDPERWERMRATRRLGAVVAVPVTAGGLPVGAYGFTCDTDRAWSARDLQLLDAVASALALWLAHPRTGLISTTDLPTSMAILTPRQCAILQLVADGRTTEAIGATLGYSASTVKQDIQRAMRALDAPTRESAVARARELGLCHGVGS